MRSLRKTFEANILILLAIATAASPLRAQNKPTPYPEMAPADQYRMSRDAEIMLARSAAPPSISQDAEVLVLGQRSYETAARGKNGFVCMVQRSWTASFDDPEFWNPKLRAPICLNSAAARSYLPINLRKTKLVLSGYSKSQIVADIKSAFESKELPPLEGDALGYMMSKEAYLSDHDGRWRPHLMLFAAETDPSTWGAGMAGSPVLGFKDSPEHMTVFLIPVGTWSDGETALPLGSNH
jgi:hypothetical protein